MKQARKILMLMLSMALMVSLMASVTVSAEGTVTIPVVTAVNAIIDGKTPGEIGIGTSKLESGAFLSLPGSWVAADNCVYDTTVDGKPKYCELTDEGYLQFNGIPFANVYTRTWNIQGFNFKVGNRYTLDVEMKAREEDTEVELLSEKQLYSNSDKTEKVNNNNPVEFITLASGEDFSNEWIPDSNTNNTRGVHFTDFVYYGYDTTGDTTGPLLYFREHPTTQQENEGKVGYIVGKITLKEYVLEEKTLNNLSVAGKTVKVGEAAKLTVNATEKGTSTTYDVTENSNISYVSNNTAVAEVDAKGNITAKSAGAATITVKLGKSGEGYLETTAIVTVENNAPVISASLDAGQNFYNVAYKVDGEDKTAPYSIIVYGKVTGTDATDYGFKLTSAENGANNEKLNAKSKTVAGDFAIRLVANEIEPGIFTFVPYYNAGSGDVDGEAVSATLTK